MLMESFEHPSETNYFVTFTYDDEHLPLTPAGEATLDRQAGVAFRKRLQKQLGRSARYFWVGEYGETTERPHYHGIFFGLPPFPTQVEAMMTDRWGQGHTVTAMAEPATFGYVAQYCVKKLTRSDDTRLGSRLPEFSQMSRRPALGDTFITKLASKQKFHVEQTGDVSNSIRYQGKIYALSDRHRRMWRRLNDLPLTQKALRELNPDLVRPAEPTPTATEIDHRQRKEVQHAKRKRLFSKRTV